MSDTANINSDEDRLIRSRKNNLNQLIDLGIDPYPKVFYRTHSAEEAVKDLEDLEKSKKSEEILDNARIAGRVTGIRGQGKMVFVDIKDRSGTIQAAMKKDILEETFNLASLVNNNTQIGPNCGNADFC